jgi:hypothetical protein
MRDCGEGGRRATLNTCAFVLATLVAGGELDEDKAREGCSTPPWMRGCQSSRRCRR